MSVNNPPIPASIFKQIISNSKKKVEAFEIHFKHNMYKPDIHVTYEDNKIIVSGEFIIDGELLFEPTELYDKEIIFDGGNYKKIIFRGGKFKKIIFRRGNYNGFVSIRGGTIENLTLLGGNFIHWLGTIEGKDNLDNDGSQLSKEPLIINRFEIEGGTYLNNIWISGGTIDSLEIKCVSGVKIHCKPNDDKHFDPEKNVYTERYSSSPVIRNLIISRYSNKDTFYHFSDLKLETIKFENFTNLGNITLSKIKLKTSLQFENSDLGKTTFIDCNFENQTLYFDSSKITEVALAGSNLPAPSKIISYSIDFNSQKRLALSQIKKVYQNMGDSVTAGKYQSEELNTYMCTLKRGAEKFNLWLNKLSNNHGQSWERALLVMFISSSFFYFFFCLALGFKIDFSSNGFRGLINNLGYLLEFINPIRKSDFLPKALAGIKEESLIPILAIFIDSLSKVFNAYLIYQFIAAFRKYGKKSE